MKFKFLISLGLLALASTAANATTYTLQYISYTNPFAVDYRIPGGTGGPGGGTLGGGTCSGCLVSTATEDGTNFTLTGAAWSANAFGNAYSTSFDGSGLLGAATTLVKTSNVCTQTLGTFCTANKSGFGGGTWYTGFAQDGTTVNAVTNTSVTVVGTELYVKHTAQLSEASTSPQSYTLVYSTVPVPAAVWLFGSSLGLLGLARRKLAA